MKNDAPVLTDDFVDRLRRQRWFRSKGKTIRAVTIDDYARREFNGRVFTLLFLRVEYAGDASEIYFFPLTEETGEDGFREESFRSAIVSLLADGRTVPTENGAITFRMKEDPSRFNRLAPSQIRLIAAEQSNTSLVLNKEFILKIYRKVEEGINPEVEMLDFLADHRFNAVPRFMADITYQKAGGRPSSLGLMQTFVPNNGDGWASLLQSLERYYPAFTPTNEAPWPEHELNLYLKDATRTIRTLGKLTGAMHASLSSDTADPAFRPEPISKEDTDAWKARFTGLIDNVRVRARSKIKESENPAFDSVAQEIAAADPALQRSAGSLDLLRGVSKIRHHGDFHLGQALDTGDDWVIFDFEGEPLRSVEERKRKTCALKDVAGMLRSFDYAAAVSLDNHRKKFNGSLDRPARLSDAWRERAQSEFLAGYLEETFEKKLSFLPTEKKHIQAVLTFYQLEKAVYELDYELNNRPDWIRIPLSGMQRLLNHAS